MTESAFPMKEPVDEPDRDPTVVSFEDADRVFEALASATARDIVTVLGEEPATPSEIADRANTSVQNVAYHLDQLADADLVEVVDSWYSEKGVEMDVYAPSDPVVVCFGDGNGDRIASGFSPRPDESDPRFVGSD